MEAIREFKNIIIKSKNNRKILADLFIPAAEQEYPVVIFSHGFKGFKDWGPFDEIGRDFANEGFVFLKFNYSFNGTTPDNPMEFGDLEAFGNNNFTKEMDDLERVIDWVNSEQEQFQVDSSNVSLLGHSRGGAVSILKAAEDIRIKSLATWGAVADFTRFFSKDEINNWKKTGVHFVENSRTGQQMPLYLQLYFDFIQNHHRFSVKQAVNKLKIPLLLIHGTSDESVDISHALELYQENQEFARLLKIEGGDHTFGAGHPFEPGTLSPLFEMVIKHTMRFFKSV